MKIHGIIWLRNVVDKLAWKHNLQLMSLKASSIIRLIIALSKTEI
jgi:hypothetical protein